MLRVSARRHAAGGLSFFSHGPSYGAPELWLKDAKSGSATLFPFPTIRDQAKDRRQTDQRAKPGRAGHGSPVTNAVNHGEQTKQDEKGQGVSVDSIRDHQHAQHHAIISETARCSPALDERSIRKETLAQTRAMEKSPETHKRIGDGRAGLFIKIACQDSHQERLIQRLNEALANASRATYSDSTRVRLWLAYNDVKEHAPSVLKHLPEAAWKRLWKIQASLRPTDPSRLDCLGTLLSDIKKNGRYNIKLETKVLELERRFAAGAEAEALSEWHSYYLGSKSIKGAISSDCKRKEWLELGVRLHALHGDVDHASLLVQEILRKYRNCDPRFIFVQILSFNQSPYSALHRQAWVLYLQLRQLPKFSLCLDDYQGLVHSFLEAKQQKCALAVLRDMTKLDDVPDDILAESTLNCIKALHATCQNEKDLEKYSILALAALPRRLQNASFYTSWIGQTYKHGTADDIARVIELMFERGLSPRAWHLDALIKAWLDMNDPRASVKAKSLAWTMIQKRQTSDKKAIHSSSAVLAGAAADEKPDPLKSWYDPLNFTRRPIREATANTFLRLARHYADKGYSEQARYVIRVLMSTAIRPTRRQIRGFLATHFMMDDFEGAWKFFLECSRNEMLPIDLATYSTLWQGLGQQLNRNLFQPPLGREVLHGFPSARVLFSHMQEFIDEHSPIIIVPDGQHPYTTKSCPENVLTRSEADLLYNRVVRAFTLSKDSFGTLIAMQTLSNDLGITPNVRTVATLVQHVAHEAMQIECKTKNQQRMEDFLPMSIAVLASLYRDSDLTAPDGHKAAQELFEPAIESKGRSLLSLLENFLTTVMKGNFSLSQIDEMLGEARGQMGLAPDKLCGKFLPGS